jgi:hypothetical protein
VSENTQEQTPPPAPRGGFSTRWQPGESGNRRGRPRGAQDRRTVLVRSYLVDAAQEAADTVLACMRQTRLVRTRLRAASEVLDRVGVARVSRQEVVALDSTAEDEQALLEVASDSELEELGRLTDAVAAAQARIRARIESQPEAAPQAAPGATQAEAVDPGPVVFDDVLRDVLRIPVPVEDDEGGAR